MSRHIRTEKVRIRKEHRCFTCSEKFPPGSKMIYNVGVWEGNFCYYYLCHCCDKFIALGNFDEGFGEGEFSGEPEYKKFKEEFGHE